VTDFGLFTLFLYLHIGAAIIAFGPTFAFPVIGGMGAKEPAHANFALRITEALEEKFVLPFAISMPFTGALLIFFGHFNLLDRTSWWLGIGIVLYAIAITIAVARQRPLIRHMVEITSGGPPAGAPPAGRPAGPPPEVLATSKKIQRNGATMGMLIVVIVLLMVSRPQF
jgi:hypothetical protein